MNKKLDQKSGQKPEKKIHKKSEGSDWGSKSSGSSGRSAAKSGPVKSSRPIKAVRTAKAAAEARAAEKLIAQSPAQSSVKSGQPGKSAKSGPGERLQKLLADHGLGSRREIETWIQDGRLSINKTLAKLGDKACLEDQIELDGKILRLFARVSDKPRVILYHKPEGQICSRYSSETSESVFLNLPRLRTSRWVMVGRLDVATSGLLLFTTSGELANKLMHPSSNIEREYACRIFGELSPEHIKLMKQGIPDPDTAEGQVPDLLKFEAINYQGGEGKNHWYHVVIKTGKNREVRKVFESQGLLVSRLIRVRFGDLKLPPRLKKGGYLELDPDQDLGFLYKNNNKK